MSVVPLNGLPLSDCSPTVMVISFPPRGEYFITAEVSRHPPSTRRLTGSMQIKCGILKSPLPHERKTLPSRSGIEDWVGFVVAMYFVDVSLAVNCYLRNDSRFAKQIQAA